jgi:hypothetical protein
VRLDNLHQGCLDILSHPDVLHNDAASRSTCQRAICSEEGGIVDTCSGHIKGVVDTDVMAVLPGFPDERRVRNTVDWPVEEICEGQPRAMLCKLLAEHGASQYRQHLHVQQLRGK